MSIPAFSRVIRNHLAILEEQTGLCGFIMPRKSLCFLLSVGEFSLNGSVTASYVLNVVTGQILWSRGKAGKKNFDSGLFCLDCFDSSAASNSTPSGRNLLNLRSRRDRSADHDGLVRAKSIVVFRVRSWIERESVFPSAFR